MIHYRSILVLVCFALPLIGVPQAAAEKPRIGRYPDGTAFRTDEQGFELADHVAELEVTVDDLRKQVRALEDELADKDRRLQAGGAPREELKERALPIAGSPERSTAGLSDRAVELCQREKAALERELQAARSASANDQVSPLHGSCEAETAPLRAQITQLQHTLMSGPSKEQIAESAERSAERVTALEATLGERERKLAAVGEELARVSQELEETRAKLASSGGPVQHARSSEAQPVYSRSANARAAIASEAERSESQPTMTAVQLTSAKRELQGRLQEIQKLIHQRKELLDSAKARRREVSVKVQPLVSKDGQSLDALRVRANKLGAQDVEPTTKGIEDIRAVLHQDIALLKRLS